MMVNAMRWTALLLVPALAGAAEIGGTNVQTIYIMPMPHGLDQYIANQFTREHVLEVIADPARADAILTDRLGTALEGKLEQLHPTPKPDQPKAADKTAKDSDKSDKDSSDTTNKPSAPKIFSEAEPPPHTSTFGASKGTLFLVDAHSRVILWSLYEKPTSSNPRSLDGAAKRVVTRLKQDLAGK